MNVPHNLQISHVIDLPFGRDRRWLRETPTAIQAIVAGWTLAGIFQARSGAVVDVQLGRDVNDDGNLTDRPALLSGRLEDLHSRGGDRRQHLLSQSEALTRLGVLSDSLRLSDTIPRNALRGPSVWTYDLSVIRRVRVGGPVQLAVEANVFNLFNRPNLGTPNGSLASAQFGRITSTLAGYGPRQVQLGAKLTF